MIRGVKGFPFYFISDTGELFSKFHKTKRLKPALDKRGYLRCALCVNGRLHTKKIHRLVAEAFIPNPDNKPEINHINGIKTDNRVENLSWVTRSENLKHCYRVLGKKQIGKNHWRSKPVIQIKDGVVIAEYESINLARLATGFSTICNCCNGTQKTSGGYEWRYKK